MILWSITWIHSPLWIPCLTYIHLTLLRLMFCRCRLVSCKVVDHRRFLLRLQVLNSWNAIRRNVVRRILVRLRHNLRHHRLRGRKQRINDLRALIKPRWVHPFARPFRLRRCKNDGSGSLGFPALGRLLGPVLGFVELGVEVFLGAGRVVSFRLLGGVVGVVAVVGFGLLEVAWLLAGDYGGFDGWRVEGEGLLGIELPTLDFAALGVVKVWFSRAWGCACPARRRNLLQISDL